MGKTQAHPASLPSDGSKTQHADAISFLAPHFDHSLGACENPCRTLPAVTSLTHRQTHKDIFAITIIKMLAVFVVIGLFYATGLV